MIVLLNSFTSLYANSEIDFIYPSTGELAKPNDSVLISYDDLRIVNSKLLELDYEKKINDNLRSVISNDSIIIKDYQILNNKINKDCKKAIRQRNIAISGGILFFLASVILLVK